MPGFFLRDDVPIHVDGDGVGLGLLKRRKGCPILFAEGREVESHGRVDGSAQVELNTVECLLDAVAQDFLLLAPDMVVVVADVRFARGIEP